MRPVFYALTAINSLLLVLLLGQSLPAAAGGGAPVLRGRALEIVDADGRVRASIGILPSPGAGVAKATTVLFRLIDESGQPSVKIAADGTIAGLSFVGGDDASYLVLQADGAQGSLRIVEGDKTIEIGPS